MQVVTLINNNLKYDKIFLAMIIGNKKQFYQTLWEDFFHFKLIKVCQIIYFIRDVTKTGNGEWGMGNGECEMGNGEWEWGNGIWGMNNGGWEMGDEQWGVGNGK